MNKFKVGDRIIGLPAASDEYSVTRQGWEGTIESIELDGTFTAGGYSRLCPKYFALKRRQTTLLPKFLLRYELETDPVEEFATLPEVKARVKELLSKPSLKRDSIRVYELKGVLDVQIQDLILFKRVSVRAPKAPAPKKAKATRKKAA